MFLPAIRGCHGPVMPYEVPPFLPPYLYGLVFALLAAARSPRMIAAGVLALRALGALVVVGSVVLVVVAPPLGVAELLVGAFLLAIVGIAGTTESRIAASCVVAGALGVIWFAAWALSGEALAGVYLSLAGALGLVAGAIAWLRELAVRPPIELPAAVATVRRRR
jgi:hypothetical protein